MKKIDDLFFKAQIILFLILLLITFLSLRYKFLFNYAIILAGTILCVMSYNNQKIFKRKVLTIIYLIFGIIVIVMGVIRIIG